MKIIYEPKGAALEYSQLALNIYEGCEHGCLYCYAPSCTFKKREDFYGHQVHRKDVLKKLSSDLEEMKGKKDNRRVLLCFICDPYQKDNDFNYLTRECLELFWQYSINFQVLTKGGMKATRDFDLYKSGDAYAATLTFADAEKSKNWEPYAAEPQDRIDSIIAAKEKGIETWVSFEPVIDPNETFKLIDKTYKYTDLYKIGKINRYNTGMDVDWGKFTYCVVNYLEKLGKKYYIKDSLKPYLSKMRC